MNTRRLTILIVVAASLLGQPASRRTFIASGVEEYQTLSGSMLRRAQIHLYRDGQGRESKLTQVRTGKILEINDPVAQTSFWVSYSERVAYRTRWGLGAVALPRESYPGPA